jgi:hypothetical protein
MWQVRRNENDVGSMGLSTRFQAARAELRFADPTPPRVHHQGLALSTRVSFGRTGGGGGGGMGGNSRRLDDSAGAAQEGLSFLVPSLTDKLLKSLLPEKHPSVTDVLHDAQLVGGSDSGRSLKRLVVPVGSGAGGADGTAGSLGGGGCDAPG